MVQRCELGWEFDRKAVGWNPLNQGWLDESWLDGIGLEGIGTPGM
ncbi:hypothetical protein [Granulicella sp. WH15]|nr:hypothetical protein [Granulicella sp. WH15]